VQDALGRTGRTYSHICPTPVLTTTLLWGDTTRVPHRYASVPSRISAPPMPLIAASRLVRVVRSSAHVFKVPISPVRVPVPVNATYWRTGKNGITRSVRVWICVALAFGIARLVPACAAPVPDSSVEDCHAYGGRVSMFASMRPSLMRLRPMGQPSHLLSRLRVLDQLTHLLGRGVVTQSEGERQLRHEVARFVAGARAPSESATG
jgi:hypothetical protein